jgi:plastocyanin
MRKSGLIAIIILAVLIIGGALALNNNSTNNTPPPTSSSTQNKSNTSSTASNSNQTSATGKVDIRNMMFTPSQITVAKGGAVTWTNNDSTAHTVVDDLSNVGGPNSGNIEPGATYSFTFDKAGSYQYHCSIHPYMRGTIVVK